MPVPIVAGAATAGGAISALIAWFAARTGSSIAGISLLTGIVAAMLVSLAAFFALLLTGVQKVVPPEFAFAIGLMPSNTPACLSALAFAQFSRWAFDWHVRMIDKAIGRSII